MMSAPRVFRGVAYFGRAYATQPIGPVAKGSAAGLPPGAGGTPAPPPRPPAVLAAGTSRYCRPSISYIAGEPTKLPPNRDDQSRVPVSLSHARMWLSRPAPKIRPDSVTMMLLRVCVTPVSVTPRPTSAGSSPKPTRHLMAGTFRSYLTMVVNGGFMPLPIIPYVLIT